MLDNRIYTFLELCKVMNYRKTAERLSMTQPAVTQHIKHLEAEYQCKLFDYHGKTLSKTEKCHVLEQHARSLVYADNAVKNKLSENPVRKIAIGATKTIGEYTIEDLAMELMKREDIELHLVIDNTKHLLQQLDDLELDVLMLEGYFDKNKYDYRSIKKEEVVGICSKNHPFAGKAIGIEDVFQESLILREMGSGTRSILERFLEDMNFSVESFRKKSIISSYKLIEQAIINELGISFVYQSVVDESKFSIFRLAEGEIFHEFNYVYLKGVEIELLENLWKLT